MAPHHRSLISGDNPCTILSTISNVGVTGHAVRSRRHGLETCGPYDRFLACHSVDPIPSETAIANGPLPNTRLGNAC